MLRIDESVEHRSVIVTTSLALVCFTTIFMGSTVATVQKCILPKKKDESQGEHGESKHNESSHIVIAHPNANGEEEEDLTPDATGEKVKSVSCLKILKRADQQLIKPLLLHNYESNNHKKQQLFYDYFLKFNFDVEKALTTTEKNKDDEKRNQIISIINSKL